MLTGAAKDLTAESFEKLLHLLSADGLAANDAYQKLRNSLVRYFHLKGVAVPDDAVDITLDRVVDKIDEGVVIENATKYSFGVAHYVFLESLRADKKRQLADHTFYETNVQEDDGEDDGFVFTRECFNALSEDDQKIMVQYFVDLKAHQLTARRQKLADDLGITLNQLRLKIFRVRNRLTKCLDEKLKK